MINTKRWYYIFIGAVFILSLGLLFIHKYFIDFPAHFFWFLLIMTVLSFFLLSQAWKEYKDAINPKVIYGISIVLFIFFIIVWLVS